MHQQEIFAASLPLNPITEHNDAVMIKSCYTHKLVLNSCSTAEGIANDTRQRHNIITTFKSCYDTDITVRDYGDMLSMFLHREISSKSHEGHIFAA